MSSRRRSFLGVFVFAALATNLGWSAEPPERPKLAVINFAPDEEKPASGIAGGGGTTTLTVMSPLARSPADAWLSKAIADLLIKSLSEVQAVTILEREKMQAFSDEVGLEDSALFSREKALRVGRVAKVQKVIFGRYNLSGERVTIRVFLMDLKSQEIVRREAAHGPYSELHSIVKELVLRLLSQQDIPVTEQEKRNIALRNSDSISATEHFYRAIDFYDRGAYPEAFGEFAAASRQDPGYLEARLWLGRMFERLERHRHAVEAYTDLFAASPRSVEGLDALFFAAQLLDSQLEEPERALEAYRTITARAPATPHALEASFQLGSLLEAAGRVREAYDEFRKVVAFREKLLENPAAIEPGRESRFVTWTHALNLHRDSIVHMISLYAKMIQEDGEGEAALPEPPRGLIVLDADRPSFLERRFGDQPAIFENAAETPEWREKLYAVVVPKGYDATGVAFSVTGQLLKMRPFHSFGMRILPFPLPRDFDRRWLGAIFGQTARKTTLNKSISFHGENRRVFAVQLLESRSSIYDWKIDVRLRPEAEIKSLDSPFVNESHDEFWEGKIAARVALPDVGDPGATRSSARSYYRPKKELDVVYVPGEGYVLVTAVGDLDGRQTDLWLSRSSEGTNWTELAPAFVNSASDDFNPRLLRAGRGEVWLSWISTRRGKGWEIWLAGLTHENDRDAVRHEPRRVPLEKFIEASLEVDSEGVSELLEYDLHQNRRGEWTAVYYSTGAKRVVFLRSSDLDRWRLLADVPQRETAFGLSLTQDSSDVYRLGYFGKNGRIHLWSSNDGRRWTKRRFDVKFWNQSFFPTPGSHRMRLFPLSSGRLLMLVSDNQYGLQYARFHADSGDLLLDLVSRAGLEAYGVTRAPGDEYLVALKESDHIALRRYRSFNVNGRAIKKDTRNWPIYMETEADGQGNTWHRIFAQARRRVSDVTALGTDRDERIWWGIESGVMYKEEEQFLATDVSLGFFYHLVTRITSTADGRVWFSSKFLDDPVLGHVRSPRPIAQTLATETPPRFQTVRVPAVHGAITDTARGGKASHLYVGTSAGEVVGFDGRSLFFERSVGFPVTCLAFDPATNDLWIGTETDGLHRIQGDAVSQIKISNGLARGSVLAIELDARGVLWVAVSGHGLFSREAGKTWRNHSPDNSAVLYWNVGEIVSDAAAGVWYLPHDDEPSRGLGYFDGEKGGAWNPPHQILDKPSSMVIDKAGDIWVGTWFDGLYRLERKKETP